MKKTIRDYNLKNKKVIIRVDYNVPIKNNKVLDDNRIVASLETIKYALDNSAKVILMSHLGRVKTEEDKNKINKYKVINYSDLVDNFKSIKNEDEKQNDENKALKDKYNSYFDEFIKALEIHISTDNIIEKEMEYKFREAIENVK